MFEQFYRSFRNRSVEGLAREATSRTDLHAMKFGLVYAVLAGHSQIEGADMGRGIALATYCADVAASLTGGVGLSRLGAHEQRLLEILGRGRTSTREAYRRLKLSASELDRITRPLQRVGLIEIITETSTAGRRPSRRYQMRHLVADG